MKSERLSATSEHQLFAKGHEGTTGSQNVLFKFCEMRFGFVSKLSVMLPFCQRASPAVSHLLLITLLVLFSEKDSAPTARGSIVGLPSWLFLCISYFG